MAMPDAPSLAVGRVFEDDVPGVYDAGDPAEQAEADVYEDISSAAPTNEDCQRR